MSNKKKNNKNVQSEQESSVKISRKMLARILAGALATLMVLGTITMTIMYFMESFHVH